MNTMPWPRRPRQLRPELMRSGKMMWKQYSPLLEQLGWRRRLAHQGNRRYFACAARQPTAWLMDHNNIRHFGSTTRNFQKPLVRVRTPLTNSEDARIMQSRASEVPRASQNKGRGNGVSYPFIRMAFGFVFCGALIYTMVSNPTHRHADAPSIAERDDLTKRENGVSASSPMRLRMEEFIKSEQANIVKALETIEAEAYDGAFASVESLPVTSIGPSKATGSPPPTSSGPSRFRTDTWARPNGGGGISCVLQDGAVFEKAGVNTSVVYGTLPRPAIAKMRVNHKALDPDVESLEFFAAGISCVLHPQNPKAPTVHFNYRYFETMNAADGECNAWWFGGGTDLTPAYLFDEDAIHFHQTIKTACDRHDRAYFPRFKAWCDRYFHIPHRQESRGIGGIFFDDLDEAEKDQEQLFSFIKDCLTAFLPSYLPIIERRLAMPYTDEEKAWQQLRRGRYVEFNLVHDRGTSFGLSTPGARVESILMSLPLTARWQYMHDAEPGSREERLTKVLKDPRDWV